MGLSEMIGLFFIKIRKEQINTSIIKKCNYYIKGKKEKPIYAYTKNEMKEYENYISKNFGNISKVYHELYSPDIHVDIIIIPPTPEQNFYKLITEGVGAFKMNVPEMVKQFELERMELITYLPPDWDMKIEKQYGWIISNLKLIGRLPISQDTLICSGQTVSYYNSDKIKDNIFCASLLIPASNNKKQLDFRFDRKGKINFYQIIPLYKEELEYKLDNGLEALIDVLDENQLDLVVDFNRPNYCKGYKSKDIKEVEDDLEKDI